jgi:hypothetical protein
VSAEVIDLLERHPDRVTLYFVLDDDGEPMPVADVAAWAQWSGELANRLVAQTTVGEYRVSTVFLGLVHGFDRQGKPVLWETMVFGPPEDADPLYMAMTGLKKVYPGLHQKRASCRADALRAHAEGEALAREALERDQQAAATA